MKKACNPQNVGGALAAGLDAMGIKVDPKMVQSLDKGGKSVFFETTNHASNDVIQQGHIDAQVQNHWGQGFKDNPVKTVGSILLDLKNPSGVLGEEYVQPLNQFLVSHFQKYGHSLEAGKGKYFKGVKAIFEGMDTSNLSPAKLGYFQKWKAFYLKGGEFYNAPQRGAMSRGISNMVSNAINANPKIVLGHAVEGTVKLPALYPKTMIPGIVNAVKAADLAKKNIFQEIPELAEIGVYGQHHQEYGINKFFRGITGLADVPLKNISFFAGHAAGGEAEGLRAVQRVSFQTRFGDLPLAYHYGQDRFLIQMSGYTLNTYKLYGSLWRGLLTGSDEGRLKSAWGLVAFHGMTGALGGAAAMIPKPLEEALKKANPDSEDWLDGHKNALGELAQVGNFREPGVVVEMTKSRFQRAGKLINSGIENIFQNHDYVRGTADVVDGVINTFPFTRNPLGNEQVQKAFNIAHDVFFSDEDEELGDQIHKKYFPFVKTEE